MPLLGMTASKRLLYGETSPMHCSGVILAHSSTQTVFLRFIFVPFVLQTWCVLWHPFQRVKFCSHLTRLYSPSISQACPNVVQQTLNKLQHAFSSTMESCLLSVNQAHGGWGLCFVMC